VVGALPAPAAGERRDVRGFNAFGTDFFSFNCRPTVSSGRANPFHDARVRRAFALAVHKQQLIDRVTRLGERVASTLVPPNSIPGYPVVEGLGFDPARARAELAAAGWEDRDGDGVVENAAGEKFPTVDILYSTASPRYQNLALAMRDMWKRELRVAAECRGKDSKLYKEDLKKGNFMIARGGWYGDYGDPTTWLDLQRAGNGNNDRGYLNPEFDRRMDEAEAETDPLRRLQRLAEVERWLFTEEMPLLPICNYVTVYMYDPSRLAGMSGHPRLEQDLSTLHRRDAAGRSGKDVDAEDAR
jgi:oligopeptide transport system substrate-binding protein